MPEHGSFCWYECCTRDADAAKRFYTELFGWTAEDAPMPGGGVYTVLRLGDRDVGGLFQMEGPQYEGVPPHWGAYVWVDDVDTVANRVGELGGMLLAEPFDVPGVARMAVVRDPQGAVLQLFQGTGHPGATAGGAPGSICWSELLTTDAEGAKAFYTQLLGWTTQPFDADYTQFMRGEAGAGGLMQMTGDEWKGVPPHWNSYVAVADVDAIAARAAELGGTVLVPPRDIPEVGRFSVLQDPTGAVISAIQMKGC